MKKSAKSVRKLRYYRRRAFGGKREKWTDGEIDAIMVHSMPDTQLSKLIGHSVQAIQMKRSRVKKERGLK